MWARGRGEESAAFLMTLNAFTSALQIDRRRRKSFQTYMAPKQKARDMRGLPEILIW